MRAAVVGATGYAGSELVRWILGHPRLELAAVVSRTRAGEPLARAVPALLGHSDAVLEPFDPAALSALDVVFLATPSGAGAPLASALDRAARLVDLSADHRHRPGWVTGCPELVGEALVGARRIAAPGCFATAIQLALGPLVAAGVVQGPVQISAATGSTGSGATPSQATHHPERFANLAPYKVLCHQHVPEVRRVLARLGTAPRLHFVPVSAPLDRGILATVFATVGDADARAILADAYAAAPLVRWRDPTPQARWVRGTAFADLAVHQDGDQAVILVAIDNLGKGAAGQAVQCLNVAAGFDEALGLHHPGSTP